MRISDWSSDVCSSDLPYAGALAERGVIGFGTPYLSRTWHEQRAPFAWSLATDGSIVSEFAAEYAVKKLYGGNAAHAGGNLKGKPRVLGALAPERSEDKSELQYIMRISYAVFCLRKNNKNTT